MTMQSLMLVLVPVLSFTIAASSLPLVKRLALRGGVTATPYSDSDRGESSPLWGGVSIVAAILISSLIAGALPGWMLVGTLGLFVLGLIDDAMVLTPLQKFLMQAVVVLFVVAAGPRFGLAPWPLLDASLAAFWLLSTVNAFNLIDGLDGLPPGVYLHGRLRCACARPVARRNCVACRRARRASVAAIALRRADPDYAGALARHRDCKRQPDGDGDADFSPRARPLASSPAPAGPLGAPRRDGMLGCRDAVRGQCSSARDHAALLRRRDPAIHSSRSRPDRAFHD